MNILIMGTGYVGVTTGLLFAELGWNVIGYDPNRERLGALSQGTLPFYEPELTEKLHEHGQSGKIRFTSDLEKAISSCDTIFICVGTPAKDDGSADLTYIEQASRSIGEHMQSDKLVVIKSTVPVGTNDQVHKWIREAHQGTAKYEVVSNPEFLREGRAWHDALHPDRIVIGSRSQQGAKDVLRLYRDISSPVIICNPGTAELIKYASNAFLATKISYMNELARLCDRIGVNVREVALGMGLDERIGERFLHAGIGFGGSCFPKDTKALLYEARKQNVSLSIVERVVDVNHTQVKYALDLWESLIGPYTNRTVAVLGLAFKKDTDDMRESPALSIIAELLHRKAHVQAHDPLARLPRTLSNDHVQQFDTVEGVLYDADMAIIATDWQAYASLDWAKMKSLMKRPVILDGKNLLDRMNMLDLGFEYWGIGTNEDRIRINRQRNQNADSNRHEDEFHLAQNASNRKEDE